MADTHVSTKGTPSTERRRPVAEREVPSETPVAAPELAAADARTGASLIAPGAAQPPTLPAGRLRALQHGYGNQAVLRLLGLRASSGPPASVTIQRVYLDNAGEWPDKVKSWSAKVSQLDELLVAYTAASSRANKLNALRVLPGNIAIIRGNVDASGLGAFAAQKLKGWLDVLAAEVAVELRALDGQASAPVVSAQQAVVNGPPPRQPVASRPAQQEQVVDLPPPRQQVVSRPAPQERVVDLPPPRQQVVSRPAPQEQVVDLPPPRQQVAPRQAAQLAPIAVAANPALMGDDESQRGVVKTAIRIGATYTNAAGTTSVTVPSATSGRSAGPADYNRQFKPGLTFVAPDGSSFIADKCELGTLMGPSPLNRRIPANQPYRIGAQNLSNAAPKLATFISQTADTMVLRLADGRTASTARAGIEEVNLVEITRVNRRTAVAQPEDVIAVSTLRVTLESGPVVVKAEDTFETSTGYKMVDQARPLFPPGGPLPAHIHQTGLGDCYLQSVLMSIANTNPRHFQQMMPDNSGQTTVTVNFFNVVTDAGNTRYEPVPITIEKSLPQDASGQALYNSGADWARLIQKAFAVFAGRFGKYGDAYASEAAQTAGGYEGVASGVEYKLYGVFYGSGVAAPASRAQTTYVASADDAVNLMSNLESVKKLLEFKGQGIARGEVVNLTTGSHLLTFLQRASAILPSCIELLGTRITNLGWFKQQVDRAITEESNPRNKNASLAQKREVKAAVDAAAEALGGAWGPLVGTFEANTNNRELSTLHEMLLNIKSGGADRGAGQRFIYGKHAYTIIDVAFKGETGAAFSPRIDQLDTDLRQVSANKSTITLRNPHHGGEPNPTGAPELAEGPDRGKFTITLAQYFRNFSELDYGRVRATT